jgi:hypothetical protein
MDGKRFDLITRALGDASSRRSLLGLAAGLLAAPLAATQADAKAGSKRPRTEGPCGNGTRKDNICTKDTDCCTGLCDTKLGKKNKDGKGRCRCVQKGKACTEARNCCSGRACAGGVCGGSTPPTPVCDATTCPDGCCSGVTCVPYADQGDSSCGVAGAACVACTAPEACVEGVCALTCVAEGEICTVSGDACCSPVAGCSDGVCCSPPEGPCTVTAGCCKPTDDSNPFCNSSGKCCLSKFSPCQNNNQCCSLACFGTCF